MADERSGRALLPVRLVFVSEAQDFLGIQEVGGDNRGPAVAFFQKLGEIGTGSPWCAAFVNACAEIACAKKNVVSPLEAVPLEGFVQSYYDHAKKEGWLRNRPGIGDLFMVYHRTKKRYAHIGLVAAVTPEGFLTIEGNSNDEGSREGYEVCQNLRQYIGGIVFANPWGWND